IDSSAIGRFGAVDPTDGGKTYRFSLSGDYQHDVGKGVLEANVYAVRYKLNLFSNFTYFLDDPVNGDQFEQADDRWVLGTSGHLGGEAQLGAVPLRGEIGWEARHDRIDPVGLYHTVAGQRLETVREDYVRETSAGLFAEGDAQLAPW